MDEMYLIPMQQQTLAAQRELQACNAYSARFGLTLWENEIAELVTSRAVRELLLAVDGDIEEAYLNLCEQPLINAMGLALLGTDTRRLCIERAEREAITVLLQDKTQEQRRRCLRGAVINLCCALHVTDEWSRGYLIRFAESLLPRLDAALAAGDVPNVFIE